jgi:hypothetical protein
VLRRALYMKAIHAGKVRDDKIDPQKIAMLLRGGMLWVAYTYPKEMRATRDLCGGGCNWCMRGRKHSRTSRTP